jgi:hypothetical protein
LDTYNHTKVFKMKLNLLIKISVVLIFHQITFLIDSPAFGQDLNKIRISFKGGLALPYGQLASKQFGNGGFAVYGTHSAAEARWQFNDYWSAGIAVSLCRFPFDDNTYAYDLLKSDPFTDSLYMKSDRYEVLTYAGSAYYTLPVLKKVSFTANAGGGLTWAQTPDQLVSAYFFGGRQMTYKITPSRALSPLLTTGLSFNYRIFPHVDLSMHADYYISKPGFVFNTSTDQYTRWLTFSYVNAGLGIALIF